MPTKVDKKTMELYILVNKGDRKVARTTEFVVRVPSGACRLAGNHPVATGKALIQKGDGALAPGLVASEIADWIASMVVMTD